MKYLCFHNYSFAIYDTPFHTDPNVGGQKLEPPMFAFYGYLAVCDKCGKTKKITDDKTELPIIEPIFNGTNRPTNTAYLTELKHMG